MRRAAQDNGGDAAFRSYYEMPGINAPVWEAREIAGYFFLGGLAGASSPPVICRDVKPA